MLRRPYQLPRTGYIQCPQCHRPAPRIRFFHASRMLRDDGGLPNHYETLGLQPNASPQEIKKKFYTLSKTHHPDHNPNDPEASTRFVKISEAYATLSSAEKRTRYDRDFLRSNPDTAAPSHQGSYGSSGGGPAGSRPASGLSRRRTQFRGPPPSFYRSGGWGTQGKKRAEYAGRPSHEGEAGTSNSGGEGSAAEDAPGTGPSGFTQGFDNDVPHFDREGHFRTQDAVQRARHRARRKMAMRMEDADYAGRAPSVAFSFVLLSGVLATVFWVSNVLHRGVSGLPESKKKTREG